MLSVTLISLVADLSNFFISSVVFSPIDFSSSILKAWIKKLVKDGACSDESVVIRRPYLKAQVCFLLNQCVNLCSAMSHCLKCVPEGRK